jgi:hypothetical protein
MDSPMSKLVLPYPRRLPPRYCKNVTFFLLRIAFYAYILVLRIRASHLVIQNGVNIG